MITAPALLVDGHPEDAKIETGIRNAFLVKDSAHWSEIVDSVNKIAKIRKNGWMRVRAVLNYMINSGQLVRTPNFKIEEYNVVQS